MPALHADWEDKSAIWQDRAERARSRAEEVCATHKASKRRMLKLANRYEQMANMAEKAKEGLRPEVN
jgi:hypothetical protein